MLLLQLVLSVLFWSLLYPKVQGPPTLGLIFHVTIVLFDLVGQVSIELLPTVTDTLLFPEGDKEGEGRVRRCPAMSLVALEFWSMLHREVSALSHVGVRTWLCSSANCLSSDTTDVDYGASGLSQPISLSILSTDFPLRLMLGDKTDSAGRSCFLPIVLSSSASE